jgi:halogenation protein CepH
MIMSIDKPFDVVVMGGGPGGSSTATFLAQKGHKVLLLEKERFPRFHIGESLLPALWDIWDALGVTAELEAKGFVVKQGVNFAMFNSPNDIALLTGEYPEYFQRPYAYHVDRARFDEILLNHARRSGVEVREGWTVQDVLFDGSRAVGVSAGPTGEAARPIPAPMVVDATGRSSLIARKLGWHKRDPALSKVSYFTHFKGARRQETIEILKDPVLCQDGTYMTDIHTIDGGWIWYIPLTDDVVSVGVVADVKNDFGANDPQTRFNRAIESCPRIREAIGSAQQMMEMQVISNISYLSDSFVGDGFVLVGDASMFVDPIFSAGVTIAMRGGMFAAEAIHEAFLAGDFSAARLKPYEMKIRHPMGRIFKMIYNWYQILQSKDAGNIFAMSRQMPLLRERLIVLLSGGYDKVDMESILKATEGQMDRLAAGPGKMA